MNRILFALLLTSLAPVRAWEPTQLDVTQQMFAPNADGSDHLEPTREKVDERYYLVRYACDEAMAYQNDFFTITRGKADGTFILKKWSEWAKTDSAPPPTEKLRPTVEVEVPKDVAVSIYEMWVNALYEVRYDRTATDGLDGWTDIFTAFVRGKGWMSGEVWVPQKNLPPAWLEDAAKAMMKFAGDRDLAACRKTLAESHAKLFAYWKAHGLSPSTPVPMHS